MRTAPWMMAVLLAGAPALAAPAPAPCGGLRFESGRMVFGRTLAPQGAETEACLQHVAQAVLARPAIRSVTVAAKLPDADRLDGRGLATAKRAAEVLVAAGVPRTRVSAVAPAAVEGEPAQLQLAYVERPAQPAVARVRAASGAVDAGATEAQLSARTVGDSLYPGELLRTGANAQAELALADGSVLRVVADSLVKVGTIELTASLQRKVQLELLRGTVETDAAPGGVGSIFEVRTRGAVAGVRGTKFRVSAQDDGTSRLETLEGKVALSAAQAEVEVAGGQGSRAKPGSPPEPPRPLLAAPALVGPRGGSFQAIPKVTWRPLEGASTYRVQLARTADFIADVQTFETAGAELAVPGPRQGKWFWRVLAVDGDGFVGFPSKIYTFDVQP
ncbi:FecR domain-containing protein [Comamonas sp. JC664]|uniref:FecR family protein n=1 Tax=Comamonas sp. JC664 TaxID=2801917 RepID=UPI00174D9793|nr:FecR domain-containing protein [Comamonas sp. JC664]MBL0694062.1 FecR domain-containing protein [Comamonas sp. JC664]